MVGWGDEELGGDALRGGKGASPESASDALRGGSGSCLDLGSEVVAMVFGSGTGVGPV